MKLSPEIKSEVIEFAKDIEKRFDVNCIAVRNKYRIPFSLDEVPFSLIMLPLSGDNEETFKVKVEAAATEYHNSLFKSLRKWHCYLVCLYNTNPWFFRFINKKEKFPLQDMAAGSDLISPVIYGNMHMKQLHKEAEDFFGRGIIEFWKKDIKRQLIERNERFRISLRQEIEYCKERRKLLNKYEVEELKDLVLYIHDKCEKEKISLVVALDGSGRPIGKALEWYKIACPITYMDPHYLRVVDFKESDEVKWILKILQKELPEIYAALSENPRNVLFVDDQTGYGNTGESLTSLVKLFTKNDESSLNYVVMTPFRGNNAPSWLRKREIQGLKMAPEKSLRAIEMPTLQSQEFYGRLKKIVSSWK